MTTASEAPWPLFRDPIYDGATDPTIIWNVQEQSWWMVYTQRRALSPISGDVGWVHGSALGIASSTDGGAEWTYRGTMPGLQRSWGHDTFWAPEIIHDGTKYHMFVSWISGVPTRWRGHARSILHYSSLDLVDWTFHSDVALSSERVIDACILPRPGGGYRMWYKDEDHNAHTWAADSADLHDWVVAGPVLTHAAHEGPNAFVLGGYTWMIIDEWQGQAVYRSRDMDSWSRQGLILAEGTARTDDSGPAFHADVVVAGDGAYAFYFTSPESPQPDDVIDTPTSRRTSVQACRLFVDDGRLIATRGETLPQGFLGRPS